jgi:hypothetical protein
MSVVALLKQTQGKSSAGEESPGRGLKGMAIRSNRIQLAAVIILFAVAMPGRAAQIPSSTAVHGTLQVSQKGNGPMFNEGGITFFRVYQNGKVVEEKVLGGNIVKRFDQSYPRPTTDGDKNSFSLPPGHYELRDTFAPATGTVTGWMLPGMNALQRLPSAQGKHSKPSDARHVPEGAR